VVLALLAIAGTATWVGHSATPGHLLLLATSGPVTVIPLLFFAGAAKRLPLSSLGLLQYLAPVLQFVIGVLALHEPLPPARLGGFALVWAALAILTMDAFRHRGAIPSVVAAPETLDVAEPSDVALAGRS
jgi:chloramphenicol-sensitive protein RarD